MGQARAGLTSAHVPADVRVLCFETGAAGTREEGCGDTLLDRLAAVNSFPANFVDYYLAGLSSVRFDS